MSNGTAFPTLGENMTLPEAFENGTDQAPIYFPRVATMFAAVASIIFTIVGIVGK